MKILHASICLSLAIANLPTAVGFSQNSLSLTRGESSYYNDHIPLQQAKNDDSIILDQENPSSVSPLSRRGFVGSTAAMVMLTGLSPSAGAASGIATMSDGNLPDLPNEAVRSYLQYRIPLQLAADYYIFALQGMIADIDQWGDVGQLFRVNNNKGQGQPSKIGRLLI